MSKNKRSTKRLITPLSITFKKGFTFLFDGNDNYLEFTDYDGVERKLKVNTNTRGKFVRINNKTNYLTDLF